jgi:hypothetical protein
MEKNTAIQIVEVTGHNREAAGRVVHYLRPIGSSEGDMQFHGGTILTDEKGIIPDGEQFEVTMKFAKVKKQ